MGRESLCPGEWAGLAWLVVCLRKHAATSPLTILLLANVLVAVAGVPFMFTATA